MRHATIAGTRRATTRARSAHSRPAFDLPSGRYLHTTSVTGEHVSRIVVGNEPQPLPNSKVRLSFARPRPGTSAGSWATSPESGCPAGRLGATEGAPIGHGNVRLRPPAGRRREEMTKLSATPCAESGAKSTAFCANADIGVAEVHDSITPANKISYEVTAVTTLEGPVADGK